MYGKGGFGIVTVMVGAVVLGIFALVYTQKMQNRANFSLIADLMAFREQVMTYYRDLAANRASWECTVNSNSNTPLQRYLATGSAYDRPFPTPVPDPLHTPTPLSSDRNLAVYDGVGNCQEKFGGGGGGLYVFQTVDWVLA